MQDFNAHGLANTLWGTAKTSRVLPEVLDSLCQAAAAKVQDFNAQGLANTLWAMATTSRVLPEVFDSLCRAAAEGAWLQRARGRQHVVGQGHCKSALINVMRFFFCAVKYRACAVVNAVVLLVVLVLLLAQASSRALQTILGTGD